MSGPPSGGVPETTPTAESSPSGQVARAWDRWREILSPVLIGLLSLVWLLRNGLSYLYSEDSISFANPFNFNHSAIRPYSYLYSQIFPVPDPAPYLWTDSIDLGVSQFVSNPAIIERVTLVFWALVAAVGFWLFLKILTRAWYGTPPRNYFPRVVATVVYLVNPFSLTVIWWHFQGWTPFYAFLPLMFWLLSSTYLERKLDLQKYAIVVIVGLLLAPGLTSSFAVPVSACAIAFAAVFVARGVRDRRFDRRAIFATIGLVLLPVFLFGWDLIPYLLLPSPAYTANGYITPTNELYQFYSASASTNLWNDLSMVGFSWLNSVPGAYPWGSNLVALELAGTGLAAMFVTGAIWLRSKEGLWILYTLALAALFASAGANDPAGSVNRAALSLGGPFLILVNAYYDVLEVYVLVVAVACFLVLTELPALADRGRRWIEDAVPALARVRPRGPPVANGRAGILAQSSLSGRRYRTPGGAAQVLVGALLVVAVWVPIISTGIYQGNGGNIDSFELPAAFDELSSFFSENYSGPTSNVLVVPMSRLDALPESFGGPSLIDSSNLISNFIPYAVLNTNVGPLSEALMNWFAQPNQTQIRTVLEAIHVSYVVFDPYANVSSPFVSQSPEGTPISWPLVQDSLNASLGTPSVVGTFDVYHVSGTGPLAWADRNVPNVVVNSVGNYLDFTSKVSSASPLGSWLGGSIWSPSSLAGGVNLVPHTIFAPLQTVDLPNGSSTLLVLSNGSSSPVTPANAAEYSLNLSQTMSGLSVSSRFPLAASLSDGANISSSMTDNYGTYLNGPGESSSLQYLNSMPDTLVENLNFSFTPSSQQNWVTLTLSGGSLTLQTQLYANRSNPTFGLGLTAIDNGTTYAWSNAPIPADDNGANYTLSVWSNRTDLFATIRNDNLNASVSQHLYFSGERAIALNPGHENPVQNAGVTAPARLNASLRLAGPRFALYRFNSYVQTGVEYIASIESGLANESLPCSVTTQSDGSWVVSLSENGNSSKVYLILDLPAFPAWSATANRGVVSDLRAGTQDNIFGVTDFGSSPAGLQVVIAFHTYIGWGEDAGALELTAAVILIAVIVVRRRHRRHALSLPHEP